MHKHASNNYEENLHCLNFSLGGFVDSEESRVLQLSTTY